MKYLILCVVLFSAGVCLAQTTQQVLDSTSKLVLYRKYESAYKVLDKYDKDNKIPDVAIAKQDILLKYFVSSIMHTLFGLKDLKADETAYDYRGKPGNYSMFSFNAEEVLGQLIKDNPTNYNLHRALGEFYYEVHLKYGANWLKKQDELFQLMEGNCKIAAEHNAADYVTYYILGYVNVSEKDYDESIRWFKKCIAAKSDHAPAYYNMAYAYLYKDERDSCILYSKMAYDLYAESQLKGDAARMTAICYQELNNESGEIYYHELSDSVDPKNYYSTKALLNIYLKNNDPRANTKRELFFSTEPNEITGYNDLLELYFKYKRQDELAEYFTAKLTHPVADDFLVRGNLYFSLANIYYGKNDKKAKEYLLLAKQSFLKVYDNTNNIFKAIDKALKEIK